MLTFSGCLAIQTACLMAHLTALVPSRMHDHGSVGSLAGVDLGMAIDGSLLWVSSCWLESSSEVGTWLWGIERTELRSNIG